MARKPAIEPGAETQHGSTELAPRTADMQPGTQLAGYRIEGVVGRGGMGVVYRATHLHLDRIVALKVLGAELVDSPGFRERFLREARTAASISHPAMVTVYDAGDSDGQLYIAMQYVDGADLGALLREEGALEPGRVVSLLRQIAAALDVAHARGIVHRDVKPANVLIDSELCYLTDFGLTKNISSETVLTARGHFVGTVHYMAPEQVEGAAVDARADVYALGCVVFHALTGQPPFERESEVSVAMAHLNDVPPTLMSVRPDLPTGLDAVLATALAKRKQDRQASCGELIAELEGALQGAGYGADSDPAAEPAAKLLVAAQEPATRALVRASVKGRGMRVLEAVDAASALVIARREQPELALVDWGIAGGPAGDVRRELRDDPETAGIRIVTMATRGQAEEGRVAVEGADDWIAKPFSPLQLIHKIRRGVGERPHP
jgi:CheY-like chemotaxis protein